MRNNEWTMTIMERKLKGKDGRGKPGIPIKKRI